MEVYRYVPTQTAASIKGLALSAATSWNCTSHLLRTAIPPSLGFFPQPVSLEGERLRLHDALALAIRSLFLLLSLHHHVCRHLPNHHLTPDVCFCSPVYSPRRIWKHQPTHHQISLPSKSDDRDTLSNLTASDATFLRQLFTSQSANLVDFILHHHIHRKSLLCGLLDTNASKF